ncbi:MAG: hypothetical protein HC918_06780 [Oscillatoriales cyanobacterium SM2_1_8]|nr:hypothetical protein [Oscillatoriales cyanobacterium SM2_1_8]
MGWGEPVLAQANCQAFGPVGSATSAVRKTVSPSGTLITSDNWNTDFVVPGDRPYRTVRATITAEQTAPFALKLFLKYADNTADKFFENTVRLTANQPLVLTGTARPQSQPFQVNVFVGGLEAIGSTYRVQVQGCS